jgi:(p)ppGpp synthase/HD superfamily hydrolase
MTDYEKLKAAIRWAEVAHKGQVDKCGQPYIGHPLRVMAHLLDPENGFVPDVETLITAVLHDIVEDCGVTVPRVRALYGLRVAAAVDAISRRAEETYFDYIRRCAEDEIAAVVKMADIADNSDPRRQWEGRVGMTERYAKALAILQGEAA